MQGEIAGVDVELTLEEDRRRAEADALVHARVRAPKGGKLRFRIGMNGALGCETVGDDRRGLGGVGSGENRVAPDMIPVTVSVDGEERTGAEIRCDSGEHRLD